MPRWTEARTSALIHMHDDGKTNQKIADALGITRNAASGRIFKIVNNKLSDKPPKKTVLLRAVRPESATKVRRDWKEPTRVETQAIGRAYDDMRAAAGALPLGETDRAQCLWPVAEKEGTIGRHLFCCAGVADPDALAFPAGRYCSHHLSRRGQK